MFSVSRKVSFSVVVALLLGWAVMSVLLFQSSQILIAAQYEDGLRIVLPSGVKLTLVVDKKVYRPEEPILISLRNDSRKQIWLATTAGGGPNSWWFVQRLGSDANDWRTVSRTSAGCVAASSGLEKYASHTLKTDQWDGLVQTGDIGEIFTNAPTGTYRIAVPYLVGKEVAATGWNLDPQLVPSGNFTVQ